MVEDVQKPISIPEPTNEVDSLWNSVKALKEAVETMQGIRGMREYALKVDLLDQINDLQEQIKKIVISGGGATQLDELTDVNTSTPTDLHVLVADGVDWESRLLVETDISDLTHNESVSGLGIWRYRTEITAPPASGQIRFNNADVSLATEFYLHETTDESTDVSSFLELLLQDGAVLYIQDKTDAANHTIIEISSSVDSGAYRTYGIQDLSESGVEPAQNTQVILVTGGSAPGGAGVDLAADEAITGNWTIDDPQAVAQPLGYNTMPIYEIDVADIFDTAHQGMIWHKDSGLAVTFTCNNVASIDQGAAWVVHNDDTEDLTIAQGAGVTLLYLTAGVPPTPGNITIEQGGIVTVYKYTDTEYWCWGSIEPVGGAVDSVFGRTGVVTALQADYDGFFLTPTEGDAAYLVKGPFSTQTVQSNVIFSDKVTFTDVSGVQFDPSVEIDMRNPADNTTFFMQYVAAGMQWGLSGTDFNSVDMDFGSSFQRFRFGDPIFIKERVAAESGVATYAQIWVKNDAPNTLWFTDDDLTDWQLGVGGGGDVDRLKFGGNDKLVAVAASQLEARGNIVGSLPAVSTDNGTNNLVFTNSTDTAIWGSISMGSGLEQIISNAVRGGRLRIRITHAAGGIQNAVNIFPDGGVELTYNGGVRFETVDHGIRVHRVGTGAGVFIEEDSAVPAAPAAGDGVIWVKDDVPNTLWFTDDLGGNFQLGVSGGAVDSVFGRTGAVTALQADYDGFFLTPAEGNSAYLGISAKAADSNLLDNIDSTGFARLGTVTPPINYLYTARSGTGTQSAMYVRQASTGIIARFFQSPTVAETGGARPRFEIDNAGKPSVTGLAVPFWNTSGQTSGATTVSTSAASGGADGDIHFRY